MFGKRRAKVGVSLSGGAAFGLAHIGVLQCFEERGLTIDAITGTSAGAIIGTLYAFGVPLPKLREEACALSWKSLSHVTPSKVGLIANTPVAGLVHRLVGDDKQLEDARIPLAVTATDIRTGEEVVFRSGPVGDVVRASAAIPGVFTPITLGGKMLVDGGLNNNLPYGPLVDMNVDVTIGVDVIAHSARYTDPKTYADILTNTYNIFVHRVNNSSRTRFDVLIDPDLSAYLIMDLSKADKIIAEGYRAAEAAYSRIETVLADKTPAPFWSGLFKGVGK